jgi:hypothetical protein
MLEFISTLVVADQSWQRVDFFLTQTCTIGHELPCAIKGRPPSERRQPHIFQFLHDTFLTSIWQNVNGSRPVRIPAAVSNVVVVNAKVFIGVHQGRITANYISIHPKNFFAA